MSRGDLSGHGNFFAGSVGRTAPRIRLSSRWSSSAPAGAAVKAGHRPPPEAARSGLDGGETGARVWDRDVLVRAGSGLDVMSWTEPWCCYAANTASTCIRSGVVARTLIFHARVQVWPKADGTLLRKRNPKTQARVRSHVYPGSHRPSLARADVQKLGHIKAPCGTRPVSR